MASTRSATRTIRQLLLVDPDLAEAVPEGVRERALGELIAPIERIPRGRWTAQAPIGLADGGIGLLVLDGLLIRSVGIDGRFGAELLGEGDLLRPWQGEDVLPTLPRTTGWRVLQDSVVAVLDREVAHRLSRYPELTGKLVGRALERSRNLAVNMAIVHQPRVDIRLLMLFWHLAGRWGRVRPEGIVLRLHLTHGVLADIVAARRPTVSTALTELAARAEVQAVRGGWLLTGEPPGELLELAGRQGPPTASPAVSAGPSGGDNPSRSG